MQSGSTYLSTTQAPHSQVQQNLFHSMVVLHGFLLTIDVCIFCRYTTGNGFLIIGAHTDSPCPKLKPVSKVTKAGFLEVGVSTYGGGLWHTWFDRDLTVAGRVVRKLSTAEGERAAYSHELVRIQQPILRIPTLAIHLDRRSFSLPHSLAHPPSLSIWCIFCNCWMVICPGSIGQWF
jgi:aspartyl aminopeptidase